MGIIYLLVGNSIRKYFDHNNQHFSSCITTWLHYKWTQAWSCLLIYLHPSLNTCWSITYVRAEEHHHVTNPKCQEKELIHLFLQNLIMWKKRGTAPNTAIKYSKLCEQGTPVQQAQQSEPLGSLGQEAFQWVLHWIRVFKAIKICLREANWIRRQQDRKSRELRKWHCLQWRQFQWEQK